MTLPRFRSWFSFALACLLWPAFASAAPDLAAGKRIYDDVCAACHGSSGRLPDDSPLRLNGSGMLVLNPPWKLDESLLGALPQMGRALGETHDPWRLDWLRREST